MGPLVVVAACELVNEVLKLVWRVRIGAGIKPLVHCLMESFDFAACLRVAWSAVRHRDAQRSQGWFDRGEPGSIVRERFFGKTPSVDAMTDRVPSSSTGFFTMDPPGQQDP